MLQPGIVFVLIAIRADTIRQEANGAKVQASDLVLPAWMGADTRSSQEPATRRTTTGHGTVPIQIMATVTEEYRMDDITSDLKIRSRNNGSTTTSKSRDDLESGSARNSLEDNKAVAM
jgi:hypothetical protein